MSHAKTELDLVDELGSFVLRIQTGARDNLSVESCSKAQALVKPLDDLVKYAKAERNHEEYEVWLKRMEPYLTKCLLMLQFYVDACALNDYQNQQKDNIKILEFDITEEKDANAKARRTYAFSKVPKKADSLELTPQRRIDDQEIKPFSDIQAELALSVPVLHNPYLFYLNLLGYCLFAIALAAIATILVMGLVMTGGFGVVVSAMSLGGLAALYSMIPWAAPVSVALAAMTVPTGVAIAGLLTGVLVQPEATEKQLVDVFLKKSHDVLPSFFVRRSNGNSDAPKPPFPPLATSMMRGAI